MVIHTSLESGVTIKCPALLLLSFNWSTYESLISSITPSNFCLGPHLTNNSFAA